MIVTLKTQRLQTLEQIRDFLAGAVPLSFTTPQHEAAYGFVADQLRRFRLSVPGRRRSRSRGATRRTTCAGWPRSMPCTAHSAGRPRASCASAPGGCSAMPASSACPASPTATCTTCAPQRPVSACAAPSTRPDPCSGPSASGANPPRGSSRLHPRRYCPPRRSGRHQGPVSPRSGR